MSLTKIAALFSFVMSLCCYTWIHGEGVVLTWQFFMLLGFILSTIAEHDKAP